MEIRDESPAVSKRILLSALIEMVDKPLDSWRPLVAAGEVCAVGSALLRGLNVLVREQEFTKVPVQRKSVDALPNGANEDGAGAIKDIPGGHLLASFAMEDAL